MFYVIIDGPRPDKSGGYAGLTEDVNGICIAFGVLTLIAGLFAVFAKRW